MKRPRDSASLAHCDCDEMPLTKQINSLQLQNPVAGAANPNAPCRQHHDLLPGGEDKDGEDGGQTKPTSFEESYPFEPNSTYFSQNHLLYHLHLERVQRANQQQYLNGFHQGGGQNGQHYPQSPGGEPPRHF